IMAVANGEAGTAAIQVAAIPQYEIRVEPGSGTVARTEHLEEAAVHVQFTETEVVVSPEDELAQDDFAAEDLQAAAAHWADVGGDIVRDELAVKHGDNARRGQRAADDVEIRRDVHEGVTLQQQAPDATSAAAEADT